MQQTVPITKPEAQIQVNAFIRSVYNWMALGLALTGVIAWFVAHNEPILRFMLQFKFIEIT